jgi:DNA-binding NarL/FixJ family response regulator
MQGEEDLKPVRVLLAEDHAVVREAMRIMLELEPSVEVVGEATNGEEAVDLAQLTKPQLVLMDIRMEKMDGVEATRRLSDLCPEIAVLILTGFAEDRYLMEAVEAGARGFMLKDATQNELVEAIFRVANGESLVTPSLLRRLLEMFAKRQYDGRPVHDDLTPREMEVLQALAKGQSNDSIADELSISTKTVKTHMGNIFGKLQVDCRSQAILYAIRERWVQV